MLIANKIGNNSNNYVMVYKDNPQDAKGSVHFKPNMDKKDISETVKQRAYYKLATVNHATVKTTKEYWVWKNKYYRYLFQFDDDNKKLIKQTSVVILPKDTWLVLNSNEAKILKNKQQSMTSDAQIKMKKVLQSKMISYKEAHPKASKNEIQNYINKEKQRIATQQIKEMIK